MKRCWELKQGQFPLGRWEILRIGFQKREEGTWVEERLYFFKFKFIYFNWRLITLQYCIGFAIHQHESAMSVHIFPSWTPLPPPSPSHPSGSSPCTSPKHALSCIRHRLVIHFLHDSIHVSMPFSQIILPSPSPSESKSRNTHLCLFCCLAYRVVIAIFLNSIYMC